MSDHRLRQLAALASFCAVLCFLALAVESVVLLSTRKDVGTNTEGVQHAKDAGAAAATKTKAVERKANSTKRQLKQVDRKVERTRVIVRQTRTVLREKGILGPTGRQGLRGPGPTDAQVAAAVERYCNTHVCGRPPTVEQVVAGLRQCSAGGGCRGQDGAPGKDAPPPTDQQIASAVEDYCGKRGGCAGPMGMPGPAGESAGPFTFSFQGPDGVLHVCTIDPALGVESVQACAS